MLKLHKKYLMNTLNQTYKELAIPYFKEVFDCVDEIMAQHNIPVYLIGATAMALEHLKHGIKPVRGTKDIDFAIMVASMEEYRKISTDLIRKGFKKVRAPWTFYSEKYQAVIDILPFGKIEKHDAEQLNTRHTDLHMLGFKEVLQQTVTVRIEEKIANIPSLPGMVILKLIAWNDRPEDRADDLTDILNIIEHYFNIEYDEILQNHFDIFPEEEDFDELIVGAQVLGRKARQYLEQSETLSNRILEILNANLQQASESKIARVWAGRRSWEIEYAFSILKSLQKGLLE